MVEIFFQHNFEKIFNSYVIKVFVCLLAALSMFSCAKDDVRRRQGRYGDSHSPKRTYRPNSFYYSKPYALYPENKSFDQDQYYVMPYGYNESENAPVYDMR